MKHRHGARSNKPLTNPQNRLNYLRLKHDLTAKELAEKTQTNHSANLRYERTNTGVSKENLLCIARFFGVSLECLIEPPTKEELSELQELIQKRKGDVIVIPLENRAEVIKAMLQQGISQNRIANVLKITRQAVSSYVQRHNLLPTANHISPAQEVSLPEQTGQIGKPDNSEICAQLPVALSGAKKRTARQKRGKDSYTLTFDFSE